MKEMAHHLLIGPILVNPETSKRRYEVLGIRRASGAERPSADPGTAIH